MGANFKMSKVGFPIRKSSDQRLFAPSRSISQRTTSFIASYRQGIHQMPLSHLIALISNAHQATEFATIPSAKKECESRALYIWRPMLCGHSERQTNCAHCHRKTRSYSRERRTEMRVRMNRPEVNQTKPKLPLGTEDLCR